jgi:hypothetical protein
MNTIQRCYLDQWGKQNTIQKANDWWMKKS